MLAPAGATGKLHEEVNDGLTPINSGWYVRTKELPVTLTVDLAGDDPVPVAGVLLHPLTRRSPEDWMREFDVLVSEDGTTYHEVYSGTLQRTPVEQAFVFESVVPAGRHLPSVIGGGDLFNNSFPVIRVRSKAGEYLPANLPWT